MPKKGGIKDQAVTKSSSPSRFASDELTAERARWRELLSQDVFTPITIEADGKRWPLRDDQKTELRRWCDVGKWDEDWLFVKNGVPRHFVANNGDINSLVLREPAAALCEHGCKRAAFGAFTTCCTHCKGVKGPHAGDCQSKHCTTAAETEFDAAGSGPAALDNSGPSTHELDDYDSEPGEEDGKAVETIIPAVVASAANVTANGEPTGETRPSQTLNKRKRSISCRYHAFISYRRSDGSHLAGRVYDALSKQRGLKVFFDKEALRGNFKSSLEEGVSSSHAFVAVVTRDYLHEQRMTATGPFAGQTDFCRAELTQAIAEGKVIVPLVEENFLADCFSVAARIGGAPSELFNHDMVKLNLDYWDASLSKLVHHLSLDSFESAADRAEWKLVCEMFLGDTPHEHEMDLRSAIYQLNQQLAKMLASPQLAALALSSFQFDYRRGQQTRSSFCVVLQKEHLLSNSAIAAQLRKQCDGSGIVEVRGAAGCRTCFVEAPAAVRHRAEQLCKTGQLQLAGQTVLGISCVVQIEMKGKQHSLQQLQQLLQIEPSLQPALTGKLTAAPKVLSCSLRRCNSAQPSGPLRVCATLQGLWTEPFGGFPNAVCLGETQKFVIGRQGDRSASAGNTVVVCHEYHDTSMMRANQLARTPSGSPVTQWGTVSSVHVSVKALSNGMCEITDHSTHGTFIGEGADERRLPKEVGEKLSCEDSPFLLRLGKDHSHTYQLSIEAPAHASQDWFGGATQSFE